MIQTPADMMVQESTSWLSVVLNLPDGTRRFQQALLAAEQAEVVDTARMISLAHAAIVVASQDAQFAGWYSEKAQTLMRRVVNALVAMEATRATAVPIH